MKSTTYTDEQLQFIVALGGQGGLTWQDVADSFNEKFESNKTANAVRKLYEVWKDHDFSSDEYLKNLRAAHTTRKSNSNLRKANKELLNFLDIQDDFLDKFEDILSQYPLKTHKAVKLKKSKKKSKRTI